MGPHILTKSKTRIYQGKSFYVTSEELQLPGGQVIKKDIVRHPGAVVLLPQLSADTLVLIRQYRFAVERELLEFPAGTLEPQEDPLHCAKRELAEETGFEAREWTPLGHAFPAPGFCDELHHYFLARSLTPYTLEKDEDEIISVCTMTVKEVEQAIANEELIDTKSITAFVKAKAKGFL